MPANGSIQSQPKVRARSSPTMTRTETAASAMHMDDGRPHVVVSMAAPSAVLDAPRTAAR